MGDESDFPVGYKNPPRETRFKPGQSGNPSGRPRKKAITLAEALVRELNSMVTANEGGRSIRLSKLDAIAKHLTIKAVQGDHKAIAALLKVLGSQQFDSKDTLFPLLQQLRANHERHELLHRNGNIKNTSPDLNERVKNDTEELP